MQPSSQQPDYWPNLRGTLIVVFFLLAAFLFSGCSEIKAIESGTPEKSAIRYVREMKTENFTIVSNSVKAIQTVELKDLVLVLVQYSGTRPGGDEDICETVLETKKTQLNGWEVSSGAGLCHEVSPTNSIPVTTGSSQGHSTSENPGYSTAYGLVRDRQITKVMVTWDDGHIQPVEVQENTYLAAREGQFSIKKIEAYNDRHETVYTTGEESSIYPWEVL